MVFHYSANYLSRQPTLCVGQAYDLKLEIEQNRVRRRYWLCRCGVEDGMPYNHAVSVEKLEGGQWVQEEMYPGALEPKEDESGR